MELTILAGDIRLLLAPNTSSNHRAGLSARIQSSLSSLKLLAREYLARQGSTNRKLLQRVEQMRDAFRQGEIVRLGRIADKLTQDYPLDLRGLQPQDANAEDVRAGKQIYLSLCSGCHEHPDASRSNPARDLFQQAQQLSQREFVARLLGGVRGAPSVALRNPFSDAELAGLAAYLRRNPDHR